MRDIFQQIIFVLVAWSDWVQYCDWSTWWIVNQLRFISIFAFCSWVSFFFKLEVIHYYVLSDNLDATEIPDHSNVQRVASLLGVPKQSLIDALTRRTIFASGETVVSWLLLMSLFLLCIRRLKETVWAMTAEILDECYLVLSTCVLVLILCAAETFLRYHL
jgi:Na+/melibiose symporter-like transporter